MGLKEKSIELAKKAMNGEISYEGAFDELFFEINKRNIPEDYKIGIDSKILE